jgi:hypothetical protein
MVFCQSLAHLRCYLRDGVLTTVKKQQEDGISMTVPTVALMAATIFTNANVWN